MCDPMGMIGMAMSIGMQASNYAAQQDMMSKQNAANEAWLAYQRREARAERARQEQERMKADTARTEALEQMTPEEQIKAQEAEKGRLEGEYAPQAGWFDQQPASAGDELLKNSNAGSALNKEFAGKLAAASKQARARVSQLATIQSLGGGSQFGLANRANDIFGTAANEIKLRGDTRQGSLIAYQAAKAVQPLRYAIGPNAGAAASVGQSIAGGAGKALGAAMGGGFGSA